MTSPFLAPGTEPLTMMSERSASTRTISRVLDGALHVAEVAGHVLAREHAARILRHADRAGLLCESELPWLARFDEKWWRLMTPAKPLPMRDARDVDLLSDLEDVDAELAARP